jgi:prepilin-type N-terminal cleavage/methylation domain-containing protein
VEHSRPTASDNGVGLVELLVVMILIGVLSGIGLQAFLGHRAKAYDTAAKAELRSISTSQQVYASDSDGQYAATSAARCRPSVTDRRRPSP